MARSNLNVIQSPDGKQVTVIGVNGDRVTRHAVSYMNVCHRSDGGVTIWADGEHRSQTTRVDSYGRLVNTAPAKVRRAPKRAVAPIAINPRTGRRRLTKV